MICYKDRTYCTFGLLCKDGYKCDKVLTEEIRNDAAEWAKSGGLDSVPIRVYVSFPECFKAVFEED